MRRLCPEEWRWGHSQEDHFMLAVSQSVTSVLLCAIGSSSGIGFFLHVRFTGCCSSSPPYSVSNRFSALFYLLCVHLNACYDVVLNIELKLSNGVISGWFLQFSFLHWHPASCEGHQPHTGAWLLPITRCIFCLPSWELELMSSSVWFQIIANCMSLLILSSALPVFSRTIGKSCKNAVLFKQYSRLIIYIEHISIIQAIHLCTEV